MGAFERIRDKLTFWRSKKDPSSFAVLFDRFQTVLKRNNEILEIMADMGDKLGGDYVFDRQYIIDITHRLNDQVYKIIYDLNMLSSQKYVDLYHAYERIHSQIQAELEGKIAYADERLVIDFEDITQDDIASVGNKNASLGEIKNVLKLSTPDGFVLTTKAFYDFLVQNGIDELLENMNIDLERDGSALEALSREVRDKILNGNIPAQVAREVRNHVSAFRSKFKKEKIFFAVRSSAIEEDAEHSFAGQYESFLNVPDDKLLEYYKKVIASTYSVRAWGYRLQKGFYEHEISMAVGCQLMVKPRCSGVLYTMDPISGENDTMVMSATWGLGVPVVSGETPVDRYHVSRDAPYVVKHMNVVHKSEMLVAKEGGGTETIEVPEDLQHKPCLTSDEINHLAHVAMLLERYYKRPQDIEWAIDEEGELIILQSRPLKVQLGYSGEFCMLPDITKGQGIIFEGRGDVVQRGVACGTAFVIRSDEDIEKVPFGSIVIARHTSPKLTKAIRKALAILTDIGSPTGHMATVAREFRVPTIVNTGIATRLIRTGEEITVDATQNIVYAGKLKELCLYELTQDEVFEESYEYRLLRRILRKVAPLNLVDPHDEKFKPKGCQTYHDIVRFVHEKAVDELIHIGEKSSKWLSSGLRRLDLDIPLGVSVLDIGGGVDESAEGNLIDANLVRSIPMKAFLKGLCHEGLWGSEPVSVDLGSFMSSLTRTFSTSVATPEQVGKNLVVLSKEYMNMSLRLGYHFNIIDVYISENVNDNYAYFRFLGGVTEITRRSRRARFIANILEQHDFRVEIRGDLVIGRLKKLSKKEMEKRVILLGGLVAYTRQLDVLMKHDEHVNHYEEEFKKRIGELLN